MAYYAARRTIASAATKTHSSSVLHRFAPVHHDRARSGSNPVRFQPLRHFIRLVPNPKPNPQSQTPRTGLNLTRFRPISLFGPETDSEDEVSTSNSNSNSNSKPKEKSDEEDDEDSLDPPNWINPDDGTVMIEGCDFEHWLVIMGFPDNEPKLSNEEMIQSYVSTVAKIVGSEEEAKKKIYSVSTSLYTGFGVALSQETALTLKGLPNVLWVLPDSYIDVPSKDYGGDLYQNGVVISRPEYQVPMPEAYRDSDSDIEYLDPPLNDFEYENEQLEETDKVYEQLKETIRTAKKNSSPSETDGCKEDAQKLFVMLRDKMQALSAETSNKTEASGDLNEVFSKGREKSSRSKIEPYESKNKDSDQLDSKQDCIGKANETTEGTNKRLPDLSQLKEAMKHFRVQLKTGKDDDEVTKKIGSLSKDSEESLNALRKEDDDRTQSKTPNEFDKTTVKEMDGSEERLPIEKYSFNDEKTEEQLTSANTRDDPKV